MRRDPTEFRQRFAAWKDGENYWDTRGENMLPGYSGGKTKNRARFLYTMDSEHFEANPYVDDVGVKTSGYGFTKNMDTIQNAQDRSYTKDEARRVLEKEMDYRLARTYKYLNPEIRKIIQSNPQLEEMLGDALWQSPNGYGGRKSSLVAALNSRNLYGDNEQAYWNNVANQFTRGNYYIRKDGTRIRLGGVMKRNNARAQAFRNMYKPKEKKAPTITEPIINNLQLVERPLILPDKPVLQTPLLAAELVKLPETILRAPEHLNYPVLGNDYWDSFFNNSSLDLLQSLIQQLMTSHKHGKNILPRHTDGKTPGEYNEELVELPEVRVDDEGNVVNNGRKGSVRLPEVVVKPDHNVREAVDRYYDKLSRRSERVWYTNPIIGESYMPKGGPLESVYPEFDLITLGQISAPILKTAGKRLINSIGDNLSTRGWTYRIPQDENMAYRIIGPLERDWILEGNELSTRATNSLTKAEELAARNKSGRFNLFKAGAEHGGRKQFAKGQPWLGTTTTHGEPQYLAIPGKDLNWVSGRHYRGPEGYGFSVGDINFEDAPFGSHIDLLTNESGFTGVNPSLMDGSVIYSPYKIFGRNFGYKKLHPTLGIGSAAYGLSEYKHGKSPIHINPANRGKFNALKKRTGKTTELLTHSKNPLTRKRAVFALNSRKWRRK